MVPLHIFAIDMQIESWSVTPTMPLCNIGSESRFQCAWMASSVMKHGQFLSPVLHVWTDRREINLLPLDWQRTHARWHNHYIQKFNQLNSILTVTFDVCSLYLLLFSGDVAHGHLYNDLISNLIWIIFQSDVILHVSVDWTQLIVGLWLALVNPIVLKRLEMNKSSSFR